MKKKYIYIGIIAILGIITSMLFIKSDENTPMVKDELTLEDLYQLVLPQPIENIVWGTSSKYLYARANSTVWKINVNSREYTEIVGLDEAFEIGIDDNKLLLCKYENFMIENPDETATKIIVEDLENHILREYSSNLSVGVTKCGLDKIIAMDNYPGNPGRYWDIDLVDKIEEENFDYKSETTSIEELKFVKKVTQNNRDAFIDIDGKVWVEKE